MAVYTIQGVVLMHDPGLCYVCLNALSVHTHEIVPRSKGGELESYNQVKLCLSCHDKVHTEGTGKWEERLRLAKQYYEEVFVSDT